MSISWNEIRKRAMIFQNEWKNAENERSESQSFWNEFFEIFGISRRRVAVFEEHVKKIDNRDGYIDLFWPGTLLVEQKSAFKNLDNAYKQAIDYFPNLSEEELPKYILTSDFKKFELYNLDEGGKKISFQLSELEKNIHEFAFILGHTKNNFRDEDPVNFKAVELVSQLRDGLYEAGYRTKDLETFLARLVFCMFADDTGIFQLKDHFIFYIESKTKQDGSDLSMHLSALFEVLDTPESDRNKNLDEDLAKFPYVNGSLFKETIRMPHFNSDLRALFIKCCHFGWDKISPAIFGSLFQSIMNPEKRHDLGAHYTSEINIIKAIKPLFLDRLILELENNKSNKDNLLKLLLEIKNTKILDPACGCGNFLIIAYRELRLLEIEVHKCIKKISSDEHKVILDNGSYPGIDVDNLFGIEKEEAAGSIAQVAIWLVDHQMNIQLSLAFGTLLKRIPLKKSPKIVVSNALEIDWNEVISSKDLRYIVGNPPFISKQNRSKEQTKDMEYVFGEANKISNLDYVSCWYKKAIDYISDNKVEAALVSTNSITQGEQPGILFKILYDSNFKINFAHRTFKWSNEAAKNAQVYVVIIGFSKINRKQKEIYDYKTPKSEPVKIDAQNINAYLVDAPNYLIEDRVSPICDVPIMKFGSMPNDDGNFVFTESEYEEFINKCPKSKKFFKKMYSAKEFLHGEQRYCLWLKDHEPKNIKECDLVMKRIKNVQSFRSKSNREATKKLAMTPTLFGEIRQPSKEYVLIPRHTSELRNYIPVGYFSAEDIVSDSCLFLESSDLFYFGIISSSMHVTWVKNVCGRIKNDYRYSIKLVYNNFPFPFEATKEQKDGVRKAVKELLIQREKFKENDLATLYDNEIMPPALLKAHIKLDKAVDHCYGKSDFKTDSERMKLLFELYEFYIDRKAKTLKKAA